MKICFFMNTPFSIGGEQRVTTLLANYLSINNFDVSFALVDRKYKKDYNLYGLDKNIKTLYINNYNKKRVIIKRQFSKFLNHLNYKFGIFKNNLFFSKKLYLSKEEEKILINFFNKQNYDLIISVGSRYTAMISIIKDRLNKTKVIGWQHSTFEAYFKTKNLRLYNCETLLNNMFHQIDGYVVQTRDDYDKILKYYNYKAMVINNPNTFETKSKFVNRYSNNVFISVGRLVKLKNYNFMINAFKLYKEKKIDSNWKLIILGDGPEKNKLKKVIDKYKLNDCVLLQGSVNNVDDYYKNASVYLMCSEWEGWGMSVTEALNFSLPVIAFSLPSMLEIIEDGKSGYLVEKNNIKKFVEQMIKISSSSDIYNDLASNCIDQIKKYDISIIGKKWIELIEDVIKNEK